MMTSLARTSGAGLAARALTVGLTAAIHLWLARELGPAGYGAFAIALIIQGAAALLANLGLGSAVAFHVAHAREDSQRIVASGLIAAACCAVPALPLAWLLLVVPRPPIFPELDAGWILVALATVPMRLIQEAMLGACIGLGQVGRAFAQGFAGAVLLACALLPVWASGIVDPGGVAAAWLVANAGLTIAASALTIPRLPRAPAGFGRPLPPMLGSLVSLGLQQSLNLGAAWSLSRVGRGLVGALAGTEAAGRFAVAGSIADLLGYLPTIVSLSIFHRLASGAPEEAGREVQRSTRMTLLLLIVPAGLATLAAAGISQGLLGNGYRDSAYALVALLPGLFAAAPVAIIGSYILARMGRPVLNLIPTLAALATLVPAVGALTGRWGIIGAGVGTSIAYVVAGVVAVALFTNRSGLGWRATIVPTVSDARAIRSLLVGLRSGTQ